MKVQKTATALVLGLLMLYAGTSRAQGTRPGFVTHSRIVYEFIDGTSLLMDIDTPTNQGPGPFPALIFIHGGGWREETRYNVGGRKEALRGYVIVRPDYRLTGTWKFPANVRDISVAIRFIKKNARLYNIDPDHIGLVGISAGGHLAALAGVAFPNTYLDGPKGFHDVSSRVQAIISVSGPTDLAQIEDHVPENCPPINTDDPNSFYYGLFGAPLSTIPEAVKRANPVTYLGVNAPPIFLVHGVEDCIVPFHQSQLLYDAYQAQGLDATLYQLSPQGHGVNLYSQTSLLKAWRAFLDRTLKGIQ